jgi:hypothetical protein
MEFGDAIFNLLGLEGLCIDIEILGEVTSYPTSYLEDGRVRELF